MPRRPIPVGLNLSDVKSLISCKLQLDAVISALTQANWQGARPAIAALGIVDRYVCELYNRCEPHWLAYLNRGTAAPAAPSPSDNDPQSPDGSPAGVVQQPGEKA